MIGRASHLPPLSSQQNEMLIFGLLSMSNDQLGWSIDSNPIDHPSSAKKMKCSFLDYIQLLMISYADWWMAGLVDGLKPYPPPLSSQQNEILVFGLCSTSDDQPGWLKDSNPICHPSLSQKNEMLIFGLHSTSDDWLGWSMDGRASQWTQTPSTTPLQPKIWNACFWIKFKFWWSVGLVICHPSPAKKMKCSFLDYVQCLMISWVGQ